MMSKQAQIRVMTGYTGKTDKQIAAEAIAALDGLTGNSNFVNPPVDLAVFNTTIEAYASAIAAALDGGGKQAILERDKQRAVVVKTLRTLGHWVEANCGEDPAILKSSGFQQRPTTRSTAQPLAGAPSIAKV